jgi:sec-independent protein translocase protein TatB
MLDVGFSELMVIGVVALVVIGPERLPKVARTMGHMVGRLQRYVSSVKADISREMNLEELRKMQADIEESVRKAEQTAREEATKTEALMRTVATGQAVSESKPEQPASTEPIVDKPELPDATAPSQPTSPQLELGLEEKSRKDADGHR